MPLLNLAALGYVAPTGCYTGWGKYPYARPAYMPLKRIVKIIKQGGTVVRVPSSRSSGRSKTRSAERFVPKAFEFAELLSSTVLEK
ncbi:predicted protein [Uncinocarpus reesii 1704]|uniref:Uncharacterized protein n=1 Tax=Uncinocarpus reesii (strain UAMH 1704) TaxID=336963 RepID=C4JWX8_UNCRE|nr:uncharacterized protein UREG_06151 [Uncinocarpus reesii 1704]EEP81286.1 predicted protein [Uncinocarpus reesii 1704]